MMIIGTHRDDDINMKPPLTKVMEQLTRLGVLERIQLRGLPRNAVAQLIEALSGREPSPTLVDTIYSRTERESLFY